MDDDYDDYHSHASVEIVPEVRDGRLSPFNFGLSNRPVTSDEEEEDYGSMPELEAEEEDYDSTSRLSSGDNSYEEGETGEDYDSEYEDWIEGCDCGWCKASRRSNLAYQLYVHEYGNNPHLEIYPVSSSK